MFSALPALNQATWSSFMVCCAANESVLPSAVTARVAVEAGVTDGWWRYVGTAGRVVGIDRFGASAPAPELFEHFGFTAANVATVAREALG